jgi:flagellin-like hook-associated protein FlgL
VIASGPLNAAGAADVNGDGKLDLVVADFANIDILIGNGDGTFKDGQTLTPGGGALTSVAVGDFNHDGNVDIAGGGYGNECFVLFGNGNGSFSAATSINVATPYSVLTGDFNSDGVSDFATANSTTVNVVLSNGDGTFRTPITVAASGNSKSLTAGDFNGDGRNDLVADRYPGTGAVQTFLGAGGYSSTIAYLDIKTQQGARAALNTVNANLNRIESQLGSLGASTSRFQIALATLKVQGENYLAAAGRIQDVDVANESSNLAREQILQQAASAVLSHANLAPELALQLLGR